MREDVYLVKYRVKSYAGDVLQGYDLSKQRTEKFVEESDKAFLTPFIEKIRESMEQGETKHEPHMAIVPKGTQVRKERTPDGELHEVVEYESYEIFKIPRDLGLTEEDIKEIFTIMDKTGIGKYSTRKTLEFWYLGYNEVK